MKDNSVGQTSDSISARMTQRVNAGKKLISTFPKDENPKQRKLGTLNGSKGYFMSTDFTSTTKEEFPI